VTNLLILGSMKGDPLRHEPLLFLVQRQLLRTVLLNALSLRAKVSSKPAARFGRHLLGRSKISVGCEDESPLLGDDIASLRCGRRVW
jgi:hypothetical protein